jgi:glutamine amidotransferase
MANSSSSKIAILDYGMGNLHSVQKAFEACGCAAGLVRSRDEIRACDALVVPGVGSFGDCVANVDRLGLREAITAHVRSGKPYLGLCLGLQILFSGSEESPGRDGLGLFPGRVKKFDHGLKIPHMGWNTLSFASERRCPLLKGIEPGTYVYFVHSYYPAPEDREVIATTTDYGITFASALWCDPVMATQFHPEKSQRVGLKMIGNFIDFVGEAER